eukprot:237607-Pleurochrysis_carterae.AAC.1
MVGPAWRGAPDEAGVAAAEAAARLRAESATLAPPACPPRGFACGGLKQSHSDPCVFSCERTTDG